MNREAMLDTIKQIGALLRAYREFRHCTGISPGRPPVPSGGPGWSALLIMALAPGVPFILLAGARSGGLELAIELTFILAARSTFAIPLTARLVLPEGRSASVPLNQLTAPGFFQLLPLRLGALFAWRMPRLAVSITSVLQAAHAARLDRAFRLSHAPDRTLDRDPLRILRHDSDAKARASFALTGWLAGGRRAEYRHTLAIGTALRNPSAAAVIQRRSKHPPSRRPSLHTLSFNFRSRALPASFLSERAVSRSRSLRHLCDGAYDNPRGNWRKHER